MVHILPNSKNFRLPLTIYHGTSDLITSAQGSQLFYEAIQRQGKTLNFLEGALHDILHYFGREEFLASVHSWMQARIEHSSPFTRPPAFKIGEPGLPPRSSYKLSRVLLSSLRPKL